MSWLGNVLFIHLHSLFNCVFITVFFYPCKYCYCFANMINCKTSLKQIFQNSKITMCWLQKRLILAAAKWAKLMLSVFNRRPVIVLSTICFRKKKACEARSTSRIREISLRRYYECLKGRMKKNLLENLMYQNPNPKYKNGAEYSKTPVWSNQIIHYHTLMRLRC